VDPVSDLLLLRKSDSAENRIQTCGSAARNSNHWTTESVQRYLALFLDRRILHGSMSS
jgi:hypothetical protein